ncbi:hypothetical protein AYI70_g2448 [Smittium culicis]|uniref:Uncharacterized protein n=1 Tax=Smittium culicis TaxID=133412 RepID=A0A1R1Y8H2_9FUNG|nr:hypothetical protein AYI70_g2448 [Smittium culicis]
MGKKLISRYENTIANTETHTSVNESGPRAEKWKVSVFVKQEMVPDGMEDQNSFLEIQGLGNYSIYCIILDKRCVRHRSRFSSIKQHFVDWKNSRNITSEVSAPQIINYLTEIYTV